LKRKGVNARHQAAGLGMHHKCLFASLRRGLAERKPPEDRRVHNLLGAAARMASFAVQGCGEIVCEGEGGAHRPLQTHKSN
jgi:hypothetical protein